MPKPIRTLEDVQGQARVVMGALSLGNAVSAQEVYKLGECVFVLTALVMQQRDEIALLRKVLAQDKPAVMRNMEMK